MWIHIKKRNPLGKHNKRKNMLVMNKKRRNKNKSIVFSLNIAEVFDYIPRHIIQESIKNKIKYLNY